MISNNLAERWSRFAHAELSAKADRHELPEVPMADVSSYVHKISRHRNLSGFGDNSIRNEKAQERVFMIVAKDIEGFTSTKQRDMAMATYKAYDKKLVNG